MRAALVRQHIPAGRDPTELTDTFKHSEMGLDHIPEKVGVEEYQPP